MLIAHLAAVTDRIRVGSGGVMLPNHQPLVVAEQFGTLDALHPGRIDLGIGRAPGTDQRTARALRRGTAPLGADDFPEQLGELLAYFRGDGPVAAVPAQGQDPAVWLLGSSGYSAQLAGLMGLPFAFAHHFSSENTLPALELYRRMFRPSEVLDEPYALIAAAVLCAPDDAEAQRLALPSALQFLQLRLGRPGPVPTPDEAAAYPYTAEERDVRRAAPRRPGHRLPADGAGGCDGPGREDRRGRADGRHEHARRGGPAALVPPAGRGARRDSRRTRPRDERDSRRLGPARGTLVAQVRVNGPVVGTT